MVDLPTAVELAAAYRAEAAELEAAVRDPQTERFWFAESRTEKAARLRRLAAGLELLAY